MQALRIALIALLAFLMSTVVAPARTPQMGSPERKAIMDALRPAIEARIGPNVEFVIRELQVGNGWAAVIADPQRKGGGKINPRQYFSRDDLQSMDGLTVQAVLQYRNQRWNLIGHVIGATDMWICGTRAQFLLAVC